MARVNAAGGLWMHNSRIYKELLTGVPIPKPERLRLIREHEQLEQEALEAQNQRLLAEIERTRPTTK
jgi:hypothetical protein